MRDARQGRLRHHPLRLVISAARTTQVSPGSWRLNPNPEADSIHPPQHPLTNLEYLGRLGKQTPRQEPNQGWC